MSSYLKLEEKMHSCDECKVRKSPHDLFFSTFLKSYICKDGSKCEKKGRKKRESGSEEKETTGRRWNGAETN